MSDNRGKVSANSKTSNSSRQPALTYAETANSRNSRTASSADATQPGTAAPAPATVAAAATGGAGAGGKHRPSFNGANGSGVGSGGAPAVGRGNSGGASKGTSNPAVRSRSRDAPVRLPSRNSVSSAAAPAIQFGSLNQQTRPPSPPTATQQRSGPAAAAATSGGVPAALAKPASKPSFGSIQSSSEDSAAAAKSAAADSSAPRPAPQHGRQSQQNQNQQNQHRPGSRSSSHSRQSQGYAPGRKDSGSFKHTAGPKSVGGGGSGGGGPKPHEHQASEAPHYPPHYDGYHHVSQAPPAMAMPGMGAQQPQPQPQQAPHPHYGNNPYRNQGHSHVRPPPHSQGPYKPQAGVHYAPHHMGGQPMGYGMAAPGQPPMQAQIMSTQPGMPPMAGWMAPHQYGYMPMAGPPGPVPGPGFDPYFHRGSPGAGGPPHSMYGVPGYSMAGASHGVASQMGAPGIMQGPMGGAPMPGMTASPMGGAQQQQHHSHHHGGGGPGGLSASAPTFIPGRRPVRIVNPNTNEEVDISQQRLRSVSTASSTPQHAASGTASPAPGLTADRREPATEAAAADDDSTPKFKIPSARKVVNIVNPNLLPKAPKQPPLAPEPAPEATTEATTEAITPPVPEPAKQPEEAPAAAAEPMDIDEKEIVVSEATISEASISEAAVSEAVVSEAAVSEAVEVADLAESLAKTALTESESLAKPESPAKSESLAESEPLAESLTESAPLAEAAVPENAEPAKADEEEEEAEEEEEEEENEVEDEEEDEVETEDLGESATEDGEIDDDQLEPPPSATRSRQVTFSEPAPATRRTLTASEIVALYDGGDGSVPAVVGEILRYPRVFLDRFSALREAPANFHFEIINTDDRRPADRGSGMRRSASGSSRPREAAAPQGGGFGGMGNFRSAQPPAPLGSSEERFRQSTNELRGRMDGAGAGGGRGAMMGGGGRPPSGQFRGPGGGRESRGGRTGSTRGGGHEGGRGRGGGRGGRGGSQHGRGRGDAPLMDPADVKPLEKSENRYIAKSLRIGKDAVEDDMLEEVFDRRMRVLLNKLTLDNFDTVSDELLAWGNKSVAETDGRVLRHLVMLVYQKAIDEPVWASMYARLCYKMFCDVDKKIEDRSLLTKDGKYLCGGFLVRKYLLTKCQEDFERGWKVEMPQDMESEEYYDAMKIKRRGLGLVRFICELFLLDILTVRIMHECVKRLLSNVETPEEEETESLAKLLTTVGKKLDKPEAKNYMDAYFVRIQAMSVNKHLPSRIRFMLKDVIELRKNGWVARTADAGPKTIAEIHEDVERKKQADAAAMRRAPSHPGRRTDSHSGRGDGPGGRRAGWNMVGGPSGSGRNDQNQVTGDMSGFGNLSRSRQHRTADSSAPSVAANPNPFGAFSGGLRGWSGGGGSADARGGGKSRDERPRSLVLGPGGRTPSHSSRADSSAATPEPVNTRNMFDLLKNEEEDESRAESAAKPPAAEPKDSAAASASASASKPTMDTPTMKRKVKGIITEYMSLKDDTEFTECFKELEEVNYQKAVFEITNYLMDRRPAETEQVAKGLRVLRSTGVLSEDTAVAGLAEYSELLEDMAIDAPNAYKFFGMLMAGMQVPLSRAAESLGELVAASSPAMSVVFAYLNHLVAVDGEDKIRDAVAESNFDVTQFLPTDKRSEADVQSTLQSQGLLELFPQFA